MYMRSILSSILSAQLCIPSAFANNGDFNELEKLPKAADHHHTDQKAEYCRDTEFSFRGKTCLTIKERPGLCAKPWISFLCPNFCYDAKNDTNPISLVVPKCCEDYQGIFPLQKDTVNCSYLAEDEDNMKNCKRKSWIKDLCPLTCGTCSATLASEDIEPKDVVETAAEEKHVGVIENDMFISANQPLQAKLNLFGPKAIELYSNCEDFREDLTNAASMIVNDAITSNMDIFDRPLIKYMTRNIPPVASESASDFQQEVSPASAKGEDSFETNVQVEGIDEADIVKSTNTTVYAAYGDKLVVWDARTLKMLSVTIIPLLEEEGDQNRKLSSIPPPYFPRRRQVRIAGLLLYKERLAVIVSYYQWYYPFWHFESKKRDQPIISNYSSSSLRLYDVSKLPQDGISELELLGKKHIVGSFKEARLINNTAHIVTSANIDTFHHLTQDLSPYLNPGMYANMSKFEYAETAATHAQKNLIPFFVDKFLNETGCNNFHQITLFQSFAGNQPQNIFKKPISSSISGFLRVNTFNMDWAGNDELDSKTTSMILPNSYSTVVYASKNVLVLATPGYEVASNGTSWTDASFIQVLSLSSLDNYYGVVTGYPLNQYSMDIWDGHLRIATTTSAKWGCVTSEVLDDKASVQSISPRLPCIRKIIVDSDNFIHILQLTSLGGNRKLDHVGYLNNLGKVGERIYSVRFMTDKAFVVTFFQTDPFYTIDLSNHTEPKEAAALEIPGFSNYLHPFDEQGHLIIGVGQDADENGRVIGLQISLFNATNLTDVKLIQQYNVEEEMDGLGSPNVFSSSTAQYDPKAFRFLSKSKKLILPASIRNYDNFKGSFDGFLVFDLSLEKIAYSFNISHVDPGQIRSFCWYNAYLPSRALVHKGVVTTIKGHTVLAHDLDSHNETFYLNLDANNTDCSYGGYWLF